jgi:hypothetical protein
MAHPPIRPQYDPNKPLVGRVYRHYKGSRYRVLEFIEGRYPEVVYQNIATGEIIQREYELWKQQINHNVSVSPARIDQFTLCSEV